jgi:CoA:oxalate CoA-transferase
LVGIAPDAIPTKIGVPVGDVSAGMFTAHAILAALLGRERTGQGTVIDVALNDSLMALLAYQAGMYFATGASPRREGNYHATIAPYGTFATGDGFINITVGSDAQFRVLCEAVGAPALAGDARFASNGDRQEHRGELNRALEDRLRTATTDEWRTRLAEAGVPAGPIHDVRGAFEDEVAVTRGIRVDIDHPVGRIGQVAPPWRLDGRPFTVNRRPPLLGEHTAEVLGEVAGYTRDEVAALSDASPQVRA